MKRFVFFFLLLVVSSVWARDIPVDSLEGKIAPLEYPYLKINGKQLKLSPGARIYDTNNRIIQTNRLPATSQAIYQLNFQGDVQMVWLITSQELTEYQNNKKEKVE